MLDAALAYAALGWAVFPLAPGTKRPLIAGGGGFKAATRDAEQIRRWWTETPDANIGVATGKVSGISVVDVDIKPREDKHGDETLRELTDKHGSLRRRDAGEDTVRAALLAENHGSRRRSTSRRSKSSSRVRCGTSRLRPR